MGKELEQAFFDGVSGFERGSFNPFNPETHSEHWSKWNAGFELSKSLDELSHDETDDFNEDGSPNGW